MLDTEFILWAQLLIMFGVVPFLGRRKQLSHCNLFPNPFWRQAQILLRLICTTDTSLITMTYLWLGSYVGKILHLIRCVPKTIKRHDITWLKIMFGNLKIRFVIQCFYSNKKTPEFVSPDATIRMMVATMFLFFPWGRLENSKQVQRLLYNLLVCYLY